MIASAGGHVVCGDEVLFDCPMTAEQLDMALTSLHRHGVFCTVEAADGSWGDENLDAFLKDQPEGNSEIERWRKALASNLGIRPMSEYDGRPVYKVVVMANRMSDLDEAKQQLEDQFNFAIQDVPAHGCVNGELINRKFNKGQGVRQIAQHLNIPVSDTIGFGDSMNDLEMIQTVGLSVCMGNGSETLKKISDMVCEPVLEDGLEKAFRKLGLI